MRFCWCLTSLRILLMEVWLHFPRTPLQGSVLHGQARHVGRQKPLPPKNETFPYFCLSNGPNYNRKNIHKGFLRCGSRIERHVSGTFDFHRKVSTEFNQSDHFKSHPNPLLPGTEITIGKHRTRRSSWVNISSHMGISTAEFAS